MESGAVEHTVISVNGIRLHAVLAGSGDPVVLLSGWPQSWYAWRKVIPGLVRAGRSVIALDPRGFGDSDAPERGYDLDTVASDVHDVIAARSLEGGVDVIAHDVGVWIAHALMVSFPADVRSAILVDAAIPGVSPPPKGFPDEAANTRTWQFGFNRLRGLPELLLAGRERPFLEWLFAVKSSVHDAFDDDDLTEYTRVLSDPAHLRAGLEYYREMVSETGLRRSLERAGVRIHTPVLCVGGDAGVGDGLRATLAGIGSSVEGVVLAECGHYVAEERPEELLRAADAFWASQGPSVPPAG